METNDCADREKEVILSKRKRKKTTYRKINNQTRQKLIEMIYMENYPLKDAANMLNINYSTAKTILRIFRIEKRVEKKNADEERELKKLIYEFKQSKEKGTPNSSLPPGSSNNGVETVSNSNNTSNGSRNELGQEVQKLAEMIGGFQSNLSECFSQIRENQNILERLFRFVSNLRQEFSKELH